MDGSYRLEKIKYRPGKAVQTKKIAETDPKGVDAD
jgi:hypothetical protein